MTDQTRMQIEYWPIASLIDYVRNPRKNDHAVERMARAITDFGFRVPILAKKSDHIVIDGHLRLKGARHLGMSEVPVIPADDMTDEQIKAFRISVNQAATWAQWDVSLLAGEIAEMQTVIGFDVASLGFDMPDLAAIMSPPNPPITREQATQTLQERFMVVPFSVLRAGEGWWQDRKRAWLALGIQSELGRGENALGFSDTILQPDPEKRKPMSAAPGRGTSNATPTFTDKHFYDKKKAWEQANGREISTADFAANHWDGRTKRDERGESKDLRGEALPIRTTADAYRG